MEMKQETDSFSGSGECDRTWAKEVPIFWKNGVESLG